MTPPPLITAAILAGGGVPLLLAALGYCGARLRQPWMRYRTSVALAGLGWLLAGIVLALLKEFTLLAFDPTMARAAGYPVFALDVLLLLLVSATIVVSLQTVGNILILALIVTPPATARLARSQRVRHRAGTPSPPGSPAGRGSRAACRCR